MPRKIKEYGRQDLIDVTLPNHADSYTVISHKSVMDLSTKALEDAGFNITAENYRATHDGNIASAIYTLNFGDDPELSMMFAWSNSYNKQMRFKCGVGAIHKVHNTSMVCGDMGSWARKHTGSADTETKETIEEQVKLAKMYYEQLVSDKEAMKKINLDLRKQSQLLGMLFAEHDILTTEQASMIKQQMNKTTFNSSNPGSLWEFYNFVTIALQQSHPKTWMEDQRVLHWFISDTFKFDKVNATTLATMDAEEPSEENEVNEAIVDNKVTVDTIPENSEEETEDPAQVDLEDMIAEVESEEKTTVQELVDKAVANPNDDTGEFEADEEMQEIKTEEVIKERIAEDKAAVAEVCDESKVTYEEAEEYIAGQIAIDQADAKEAAADNSVSDENIDDTLKADFDMDFAVANSDEEEVDDDVDFDFA